MGKQSKSDPTTETKLISSPDKCHHSLTSPRIVFVVIQLPNFQSSIQYLNVDNISS
ncbi:unnamed protein product [Brassica oleracea var. botrytis]